MHQRGRTWTDAAAVVMMVPRVIIAGVALVVALANTVVHAVIVVVSMISIVPPVALSRRGRGSIVGSCSC